MAIEGVGRDGATLHDYLRVLRRRKWIILTAVIVVPAVAVAMSMRQQPLYQSTAEVLLTNKDISAGLTGVSGNSVFQTSDRVAQTQADLATTPTVARRALAAAGIDDMTPYQLLGSVSVQPRADADLLDFTVTSPTPTRAETLATAFAREFTIYKNQLDTAGVRKTLAEASSRLRTLESQGGKETTDYLSLLDKVQELRTLQALQTSNSFLVQPARGAAQIQPRPFRAGLLGFLVGLVLGLGLAFLREALDTRVRTAEEVSEALGLTLLARLPTPPKRLASKDSLVMLEAPRSKESEAFRMLRTNLEFTNLEHDARVIMVTSALESEGKSTTASNLALALARSGRHVALADLDLRRPYLDRFFDLSDRPGLTQVALGHVELEEALATIAITDPSDNSQRIRDALGANGTNGHARVSGVLEVLPSGPIPPDAGEFVGTHAVTAIIQRLRDRADFVIVDAPPLLNVGDAMALSPKVDGIILVTRLKVLRRGTLKELHRLLANVPAKPLGFVVTGAEVEKGYGYGYGYGYGDYSRSSSPRAEQERVR
jgi:polysaccharide biosynthesis transport protein